MLHVYTGQKTELKFFFSTEQPNEPGKFFHKLIISGFLTKFFSVNLKHFLLNSKLQMDVAFTSSCLY